MRGACRPVARCEGDVREPNAGDSELVGLGGGSGAQNREYPGQTPGESNEGESRVRGPATDRLGFVSVVHEDELEWVERGEGEVFENRRKRLSAAAGGKEIGCSLTEVPPGKTAWPFHAHLGNEEAIYVLRGQATLRLGERRTTIKAGDYVAFPPREDAAHQVTNTSSEPFVYLAMSTMNATDVVLYPDSNKRGIFAGGAPGTQKRDVTAFSPIEADVGYWDREPVGRTADEVAEDEAVEIEQAIEQQVHDELEAMKKRLQLDDE